MTNLLDLNLRYTDAQLCAGKHARREYMHARDLSSICSLETLMVWMDTHKSLWC